MHMLRAYRRVGKGNAIYLEAKKATGRLTKYDLQGKCSGSISVGKFCDASYPEASPKSSRPLFQAASHVAVVIGCSSS